LEQAFSKRLVFQQARDPSQGLEVDAGRILWRNQQKEQPCQPAIKGATVHPVWTQAKNGDDIFETGQLPVRDGNTFANGRSAETFTVQENGDQLLGVDTGRMLGEMLGKLAKDIGLCATLELGENGFLAEDINDTHGSVPCYK